MDPKLAIALDLGGMTEGARTLISGSWEVPAEVALDEAAGLLYWRGPLRSVQPTKELLPEFLKIWQGDNAAIQAFARHWGPLWLCDQHGLPIMHTRLGSDEVTRVLAGGAPVSSCGPSRLGDGWLGEPLGAWRRYSRHAELILRTGSRALRHQLPSIPHDHFVADQLGLPRNTSPRVLRRHFLERRLVSERIWASLGWFRDAIALGYPFSAEEALAETMVGPVRDAIGTDEQFLKTIWHPEALASKVNEWIVEGGGVRQTAVWQDDRPEWRQEVGSLFAAIGVGLWNVICDTPPDRTCKHCGQVFQPRMTSQTYCMERECRLAKDRENHRRSRAKNATGASQT